MEPSLPLHYGRWLPLHYGYVRQHVTNTKHLTLFRCRERNEGNKAALSTKASSIDELGPTETPTIVLDTTKWP